MKNTPEGWTKPEPITSGAKKKSVIKTAPKPVAPISPAANQPK